MSPRQTVLAEGHDEIVTELVAVIGRVATDVEIRYGCADGRPLKDDEEPGPDEAIIWTATATLRETGLPEVGTKIIEPGGAHPDGVIGALVDLVEKLGANVVLLDMR